jgi:hypothetical protein
LFLILLKRLEFVSAVGENEYLLVFVVGVSEAMREK